MYTTVLSALFLVSVAAQGALAADLSINTPTLTECAPATISWTATDGPYNLIVVPAEDPCSEVLADLGDHTTLSTSWTVNVPAGTMVTLSLEDGNGEEAWTGNVTIKAGTDTKCLSAAAAGGPGPSSIQLAAPATAATVAPTVLNPGAPVSSSVAGAAPNGMGAAGAGVINAGKNGAAGLAISGVAAFGGALFAAFAVTL